MDTPIARQQFHFRLRRLCFSRKYWFNKTPIPIFYIWPCQRSPATNVNNLALQKGHVFLEGIKIQFRKLQFPFHLYLSIYIKVATIKNQYKNHFRCKHVLVYTKNIVSSKNTFHNGPLFAAGRWLIHFLQK